MEVAEFTFVLLEPIEEPRKRFAEKMTKVYSHGRFCHYSTLREQNGTISPNVAERCLENSNKDHFICFDSIGTAM
jgi:hypothetical protein